MATASPVVRRLIVTTHAVEGCEGTTKPVSSVVNHVFGVAFNLVTVLVKLIYVVASLVSKHLHLGNDVGGRAESTITSDHSSFGHRLNQRPGLNANESRENEDGPTRFAWYPGGKVKEGGAACLYVG